jgi:cytochrome c oxidase subunit 1
MVATIGAFVSAAGVVVFCMVLYRTFTSKVPCPDNPWGEGATTLEWTVSSPPPFHTFNELPQVK